MDHQSTDDTLRHLSDAEREIVERYLDILSGRLGQNLTKVILYGSAARGEMWSSHLPFRSDIDLLVLTHAPIPEELQQALVDATYPLFLEAGRQIAPQFWTVERFENPPADARVQEFITQVLRDGVLLYGTASRP